jgi:hypothetical protein
MIAQRNTDTSGSHNRIKKRKIKSWTFDMGRNGSTTLFKGLSLPRDRTRLMQIVDPNPPGLNSKLD